MQKEKLQSELAYLKNLSPEKKRLMGNSQAIQNTMNQVYKVAATSASILLTGETGAGKEFIAKIIHDLSDRRNQPFITIDCTTIPENLIESELFGHEKGSFTSASSLQKGKFESASKGTVFLDEIGELSLHLQKKLLRVLQENTITRVGGNKEISIDIRVIAATNRNLDEMVANKSFRQDLYYRLNVVNIKVPPLRARKTDIITLAEYFLQKFCSEYKKCPQNYSNESVDAMLAYDWPGNVRELIHRVQRAVIMSTSSEINSADLELDDELTEPPVPEAQSEQSILEKLESATAQLVDDCIQKTNNTNLFSSIVQPGVKAAIEYSLWQADQNKSHAAWLLGIERRQLSRLKLKYNDAPENDTPHSKAYMKIIQEILDWRNQFSRKSRELSNLVIAMESFTAKAVFARLNSNISKTAAALGLTPERTKKLLKV